MNQAHRETERRPSEERDISAKPIPAPQPQTAMERVLCGALIGDVIAGITGSDLLIKRTAIVKQPHKDGVRCTYHTTATSGDFQVGEAEVVWEGKEVFFEALQGRRMREFLREQQAVPVADSFDAASGLLKRTFTVHTLDGILTIKENLFLKSVERIEGR